MIQVSIPWPPSALRPNASKRHWRTKHAAAQLYKSVCVVELKEQGIGVLDVPRLHITLNFREPNRIRRDMDNLVAQCKYALDAISGVTGVDDYFFGLTLIRGEPVKGGRVDITITEE